MKRILLTVVLFASAQVGLPGSQEVTVPSSSQAPAEELIRLMQQHKLDAIAARDPNEENRYAAALVFPGAQILAISGVYPVPALLNERLLRGEDRDTYVELNRAAEKRGRLFVQDLGADGLHASPAKVGRVDVVFVEVDARTIFGGDWNGQQLTREEYTSRFKQADEGYARALRTLIQGLKTRSGS
jgi:hypothetical protein